MMKFNEIKKYFNIEDIENLLLSLSHFPYFGALASLLNSFFDVCEMYHCVIHFNIYKNRIKLKAAAFRFTGNLLLGLAGLFPLITIASCLLVNPFILPLISFSLVVCNFYKAYVTTNIIKYELSIDKKVLEISHEENALHLFSATKDKLYTSQRDCIINSILMFGSAISLLGFICPPFFIVGLSIGIVGGILGMLDEKLHLCKKIIKIANKNVDCHSTLKDAIQNVQIKSASPIKKIDHTYNKIFKKISPLERKLTLAQNTQPSCIKEENYSSYYKSKNTGDIRQCYRMMR